VITIRGKCLTDFGRSSLVRTGEVGSDLIQKLDYDYYFFKMVETVPLLNQEQSLVYDKVIKRLKVTKDGSSWMAQEAMAKPLF